MDGTRKQQSTGFTTSRRNFFKSGTLMALAAPLAAGAGTAGAARKGRDDGEVIYSSEFVPEGASFRLAFIADHHYWPGHAKNWSGKLFRETGRRMQDLVTRLNDEAPDLSIHAGDVIDAGNAFMPPPDEYIKQLDFEREFLDGLNHRAIPLIGNHEVPDELYENESELAEWKKRFGDLYGFLDLNGWRLVWLNNMIPNPGEIHGPGSLYGIDDAQMAWLAKVLDDAASSRLPVLLFAHIPPNGYVNAAEFGALIKRPGCVKAMIVGHTHGNHRWEIGGIPVVSRAANVCSPLAYTMIHPYPDGRVILVQKSQHFPYLDYVSSRFLKGTPQGDECDRYITIGGSSSMPVHGITVLNRYAKAEIRDGHLRFESRKGRGVALIDSQKLRNARLSFTATKHGASHMGVVACASDDGADRVEGVLTPTYSRDGNMYLASYTGGVKKTLDRSWFNIEDGIAYRFVLEARDGRITLSNPGMPELTAELPGSTAGKFGFFVEKGEMYITDLKLGAG